MKLLFLCTTAFLLATACNRSEPPAAQEEVSAARVASTLSTPDVISALESGKVKFEIRGLKNVPPDNTLESTNFTHKASIVVSGELPYAKYPYMVTFAVKRLSGGDPDSPRNADWVFTQVTDGYGEFADSGGYRTKDEKWEPEKVQVTPVAVLPLVPVPGQATVKED